MAVIGLTAALLGVILIIVYFAVKSQQTRCSAQTQGTLEEIGRAGDNDRSVYSYAYRVDGIDYRLRSYDRCPDTHEVGDVGVIWYNPRKPKEAIAYRLQSYTYLKILLYVGIPLIPIGLLLGVAGLSMG